MRVVTMAFPDRTSAMLALRAIRPVLSAAAGPWWLQPRGEGWLIGGPLPIEWEDHVADIVGSLGGEEVPASSIRRSDLAARP